MNIQNRPAAVSGRGIEAAADRSCLARLWPQVARPPQPGQKKWHGTRPCLGTTSQCALQTGRSSPVCRVHLQCSFPLLPSLFYLLKTQGPSKPVAIGAERRDVEDAVRRGPLTRSSASRSARLRSAQHGPPTAPRPAVGCRCLLHLTGSLARRNCGHAEAQVAVAVVRPAPEAERRPAVRRREAPATAPAHAVGASRRTAGSSNGELA